MFKKIIIAVMALGLAILAGWTWSSADQSEYSDRLDHAGLSENTLVYKTSSTKSVQSAVTQLTKAGLSNYEVQFALNKSVTYFFAQGSYYQLPLSHGQFFSSNDFKSSLPVAVVGKNVTTNIYATATQQYLIRNGTYINVIGVVGTREGSELNKHIFLNASTAGTFGNPQLKDVEIMVDGPDVVHTKTFSKIFDGAKAHRLTFAKTQDTYRSWQQRFIPVILATIAVTLGAVAIGIISAVIGVQPELLDLNSALRNNYLRTLGMGFLPWLIGGIAAGTAISWATFYINNHLRVVAFAAVLVLIIVLTNQLVLHLRSRKDQSRATS